MSVGKGRFRRFLSACSLAAGPLILAVASAVATPARKPDAANDKARTWKETGRLEQYTTYANEAGRIGIFLKDGATVTRDNPFFRPVGDDGRSCASCHDPADSMGLSASSLQSRWQRSGGKDPVFAMVDGANCPDLPAADRRSHSLLLDRGLIRIALPWPGRNKDGSAIEPEFSLEVVNDPTGCNMNPRYGVTGNDPHLSVYRRPRITANLRYVLNSPNKVRYLINVKTGYALPFDPDSTTGSLNLNLLSDARFTTLKTQFANALRIHMPGAVEFTSKEMDELQRFVLQLYAAQVADRVGGDLVEPDGPNGLGPRNLAIGDNGLSGEAMDTPVFQRFDKWDQASRGAPQSAKDSFRASVARGAKLFNEKTFFVRDIAHINNIGLGNPIKRTCALCHNGQMVGVDLAPGWMDLGINNWPWARGDTELPLFKLTCRKDVPQLPYLGRVIYTTDPGRALITGKCIDIGSLTMQQMRGLSARAPFFSNGSARTLRDVVDQYDRRFNIGYTDQQKQDLVNFMSVL